MRAHILAEPFSTSSKWLTTADVARALHLTPDGVRWLANERRLAYERTPGGQRVFREHDVECLVLERARARLRGVAVLKPRRPPVDGEARQMSLFGAPLRLVRPRGPRGTVASGSCSTPRTIVQKT
jgi:hypothetical protein